MQLKDKLASSYRTDVVSLCKGYPVRALAMQYGVICMQIQIAHMCSLLWLLFAGMDGVNTLLCLVELYY